MGLAAAQIVGLSIVEMPLENKLSDREVAGDDVEQMLSGVGGHSTSSGGATCSSGVPLRVTLSLLYDSWLMQYVG